MNEVASEELVVEEPESLADKLGVAGPGDPVCYHVGTSLRPCPAARAALAAYYRGEVDLVQKRVRGSLFCYLAIKRRQVSPPNVPHALEALVANLLMEGARHARQHPRCIET